jgi:hypothetical protein
MLAGIGFTMALFIANLAFSPSLINSAKLGILSASVFSAVAGIALLAWLSPGGTHPRPARSAGSMSTDAHRRGLDPSPGDENANWSQPE